MVENDHVYLLRDKKCSGSARLHIDKKMHEAFQQRPIWKSFERISDGRIIGTLVSAATCHELAREMGG